MALISHTRSHSTKKPLSGLCLSVCDVGFLSARSATNANNELRARQPRLYSEFRSCVGESRGSRPGLPVLISLMVSVDGEQH